MTISWAITIVAVVLIALSIWKSYRQRSNGTTHQGAKAKVDFDNLSQFQESVFECLKNGDGGQELMEIEYSFRASSVRYMSASIEIIKTAMEFGVSPTMTATHLILAYQAVADYNKGDHAENAAVYLENTAKLIRQDHRGQ